MQGFTWGEGKSDIEGVIFSIFMKKRGDFKNRACQNVFFG